MPTDKPPERYQTLALVVTFGVAYLPLARFLEWQISAYLGLLLALRVAALRWPAAAPRRWGLLALTLAGVLNCLHAHHSLLGRTGGVALLVTMLGLKLHELRGRRDHRLVAILLGFLIVVQFLFDQGIGLVLYLAGVMFAAATLLVDLNGGLGKAPLRTSIPITLRLSLQALPLAAILFLLFPRLSTPLWNLGADRERGVMGMGDRLEPGAISELVITGELAFRARFDGPAPAPSQLYWRGLVLWEVDALGWSPGRDPLSQPRDPVLAMAEDRVGYEVVLEPSMRRSLFALDLPIAAPAGSLLSEDHQLLANGPVTTAKRYRVQSALRYRTQGPSDALRQYALRLPPNVTDRMRELVAGWRRAASTDWALVEASLAYFNREPFFYTLLPPRLGANPTDAFLFETRQGFCEHYASSLAVLMRLGGVPSRVVLGYLGGEVNRVGGHHRIWQSDAHAWVEVLIDGRGWVRVDPTAAVAASRVDRRGASRLLGANAPARFQLDAEGMLARAMRQARDVVDSLDAAWQHWILDFSVAQQEAMLDWMGLRAQGERALVAAMAVSVSLVLGLILITLLREGRDLDPMSRGYALFCRRLARVGLVRRADEGPLDFARRVGRARPDLAGEVQQILGLYVRERYSRDSHPDQVRQFVTRVRRFRPGRRTL